MQSSSFGENLRELRRSKRLSQSEFAEFLDVTQPSLSAYEQGRTSPTMEVLLSIAKKCGVSLDWLCGLPVSTSSISTTGDIADFFYNLMEIENLNIKIEIQDRVDIPTETKRNYVRLSFDINDLEHPLNMSLYGIIKKVNEHIKDLESYALSKEMYEMAKKQTIDYHTRILTKKEIPEFSRDEQLRKRREYLEQHPYE